LQNEEFVLYFVLSYVRIIQLCIV